MGIAEQWERKSEETAARNAPEEPQGPTLNEIRGDREQSLLFGKYLQEKGVDKAVSENMLKGKLQEHETEALMKSREEYLKLGTRAEKLNQKISGDLEKVLVHSPEFKRLVDSFGADNVKGIFARKLHELAITDEASFKKMESEFAEVEKKYEKFTSSNEEVKNVIKNAGLEGKFTESEIFKAMWDGDRKKLEKMIAGSTRFRGIWQRAALYRGDFIQEATNDLMDVADDMKTRLKDVEGARKMVGLALRDTLSKNSMMHTELTKNLSINTHESEPEDISLPEIRNMLGGSFGNEEQADLRRRYRTSLDQARAEAQRNNQSFDEKDFDSQWYDEEVKKKMGDKKGHWATILFPMLKQAFMEILKP